MLGDLIFCRPGRGLSDWQGNMIAYATQGPFCHVEIDAGYGQSIGALSDGIKVRPAVGGTVWVVRDHGVSEDDINAGMDWALKQKGDGYGYSDLISNILKTAHIPFILRRTRAYDCSDFAASYLIRARYDIGPLQDNPAAVSPNDLARTLGVI